MAADLHDALAELVKDELGIPFDVLASSMRHSIRRRTFAAVTAAGMAVCVVVGAVIGWQQRQGQPSVLGSDTGPPVTTQTYPQWGFSVERPLGWTAYPYTVSASLFSVIGYLSTDRLTDPCAKTSGGFTCGGSGDLVLLEHLSRAGVLVTLGNSGSPGVTSITAFPGEATTIGGEPARVDTPTSISSQCQTMGGATEIRAVIARPDAADNFLTVTACLADPSVDSRKEVQRLFDSLRFIRVLALDTHPTGSGSASSVLGGTFGASSGTGGGGCGWLEHDGHKTYIRWPEGYWLRASDLALLGPDGAVIARVGDHLAGGGGISGPSANGEDTLSACGFTGVVFNLTLASG
ncbi:MAG: hypothetical protein QOG99_3002 [Frankiales bacterium]|jgi:hypothetical protein|nr:hypothetical protein [Frankiales bacterium]